MDSISESINVGIVIRPKRYYTSKDEGTPAFRNCNIQGGSIDDSEWVYLKATAAKENPRSVVRYGDVLIARSGNAGNCCVVPKTYSGYGAIDVIIARPLVRFVSPDFLAVNLCAASTQTMLASISRGVALSHLGVTTISSLPMPLPPLTEQKRIVAKVKELFAIADSLGVAAYGLENAAKRLDKKILDLAIHGKLVPQDPNDEPASELLKRIAATSHKSPSKNQSEPIDPPFDIPDSWEWVRLEKIISLLSGRDLAPQNYSSIPQKYPYMTGASNFSNGELLVNRWTNVPATISHNGDLLITCKGTVGVMAFNTIGDIHIARQIMAISSSVADLHYVKVFLSAIVSSLKATATSMIPGIGRSAMLNLLIPLPPLNEQKRIVERVEELKATTRTLVTF